MADTEQSQSQQITQHVRQPSSNPVEGLRKAFSDVSRRFTETASGVMQGVSQSIQRLPNPLTSHQPAAVPQTVSRRKKGKKKGRRNQDELEETFQCTGVSVEGVDGPLQRLVTDLVDIQPDTQYSVKDVENNVRRVFESGFFKQARPVAEQQRGQEGMHITIQVEANPILEGVVAEGADAMPARIVRDAFDGQPGKIINFGLFGQSLKALDFWYQSQGIFGQVASVSLNDKNVAEVKFLEMPVKDVKLMFRNKDSGEFEERAGVAPRAISRWITTRTGQAFSIARAQQDVQALDRTGLFEDVDVLPRISEGSSTESPAVDVLVSLSERKALAVSGGGGFKQGEGFGGVFGTASFSHRNLFGKGQKLAGSLELGQNERAVSLSYSDPWVADNSHMISQRLELLNSRTPILATHGRPRGSPHADLHSGYGVHKVTGGGEWAVPLSESCQGKAGIQWQRATCTGLDQEPVTQDGLESPLTWSGAASDDSLRASVAAALWRPDKSRADIKLEQGLPLNSSWPVSTRVQARAAQASPVMPYGLRAVTSLQGGTVLGDLPPYEATPIGGVNSVRGYPEGEVGTGRSFVVASGELRLPVPVKEGGVQAIAFVDWGSDLGSGCTVKGNPAAVRGKAGHGYGAGVGLRIDTGIGPLRFEYAINDRRQRGPYFCIGSASIV